MTTCQTCNDKQPCTDHPETLVGSEWKSLVDRINIIVLQAVTGHSDKWVLDDGCGRVFVARGSYLTDNYTRLPDPPPPMPELVEEWWAGVWPTGFAALTATKSDTRNWIGCVGVVRMVPDPTTWDGMTNQRSQNEE